VVEVEADLGFKHVLLMMVVLVGHRQVSGVCMQDMTNEVPSSGNTASN